MTMQRSDVGQSMNRNAEMSTSMNQILNRKSGKRYFPGLMILAAVVVLLMLSAVAARTSYADTVTIRPDSVVSAGGWTINASDVNDNNDATYATITGSLSSFTVSMANDVAYSGNVINSVTSYVKAAVIGGSGQAESIIFGSSQPTLDKGGSATLPDNTPSPFSYGLSAVASSGDIDALEIDVETDKLGAGEEARITDIWVVVDYTPAAGQNEITTCDGCHGQPPVEGASRDGATGAVVGSHSVHNGYACTVCHPNNVVLNHRGGTGANNIEGRIDMLANIQGGTYSLGSAGFLQNNEDGTGLGTCSDVSCHGGAATTTPKWGTTGGLGCDGCHGAPPATGAHGTHYSAKGWGATDSSGTYCVQCHPDNTAGHSDVTDGLVIVNAGLTWSAASGTCSSAPGGGCHNGAVTPWDTVNPGWANYSGIACVDCHTVGGTNSATVANPVTGLHDISASTPQPHDDTLATGCEECHTKASISGHWDGVASGVTPDYTGAQAGITAMTGGTYTDAGGTGTVRGTCATTCHSDNANWSRQWSTDANSDATTVGDTRCAVCHGDFTSDWRTGTSHEQTFGGSTSTRGAGHNSGSGSCEDCHSYPSLSANHNTGTHYININDPGTGITESGGRAWCADCHSDDGAPTTNGTHTFTQSVFPLQTVDGATDPVGSCTGCHGTGGANYWPDASTGHVANDQPGKHLAHMTLLARRVYNEDIATLLTDSGNGTTDFKQKSLCDYCHMASSQDATHNNGTANVFPSATYAKRYQDGASDSGTLASYDGGASGTCSSVDCHNSKSNLPGTYGWYDGGAADCDMCHTPGGHAEDFANPTSGLHNITPTISGTTHDQTLTACDTCHALIPDNYTNQGSAHVDGTFTANSGSNTDRYLFSDYTDGSPGTCAGGNVGLGGCHDQGDGGTWNRRWSTTAANSDGTECDNCHGGVNGEGTWTFGSNNVVGDGSMSHDRNWDGSGVSEVIGEHSADTSNADRCNTCHVYDDGNTANYGTFAWGAGNHGDDEIDMNSTLGYSRSGGDAYGCTSNCHSTGGSHLTENSGWTLGAVAGASLGCTSCHTGNEGANDQTEVGTNSPHSEVATGFTCEQCHFDSHGNQGSAIPIPWDNRTMGTDYTDTAEIHIIAYGGATNEAESCWNCHAAQGPGFDSEFDEGTADADVTAPGPRPEGTLSTGESTNWVGATWHSANFAYKSGPIASIHQPAFNTGVNPAIDTGLTAADEDTISCTACHDVHQVGSNGYESGAKPWLRGTWTSNPFPEDGAPRDSGNAGSDDFLTFDNDGTRGALPRTAAGGGAISTTLGGWQIEQNNGVTFNQTYGTFGGLCQNCHTQAGLESAWPGHAGVVSGFTGNTGNNIFNNTQRGGGNGWQLGSMAYASTTTNANARDTGKGWIGGLRNNRQWSDGVQEASQQNYPNLDGIGSEPTVSGVAISYAGGAVSGLVVDTGTAQNNFHNFPCSKCHDPHASRLPRLMVTNCLDINHNTWDDGYNPSAWTPGTYSSTELAYSSSAQNCHRYVNSGDSRKEAGAEAGWNTVTPWTEF